MLLITNNIDWVETLLLLLLIFKHMLEPIIYYYEFEMICFENIIFIIKCMLKASYKCKYIQIDRWMEIKQIFIINYYLFHLVYVFS